MICEWWYQSYCVHCHTPLTNPLVHVIHVYLQLKFGFSLKYIVYWWIHPICFLKFFCHLGILFLYLFPSSFKHFGNDTISLKKEKKIQKIINCKRWQQEFSPGSPSPFLKGWLQPSWFLSVSLCPPACLLSSPALSIYWKILWSIHILELCITHSYCSTVRPLQILQSKKRGGTKIWYIRPRSKSNRCRVDHSSIRPIRSMLLMTSSETLIGLARGSSDPSKWSDWSK